MSDNPIRLIRWPGLAIIAALLVACGASNPTVVQHLDPLTGVTITRAAKPIVLYQDRSAQAANARDYVYLGPVQVNNMGERRYFLWLGIWGTSDNRSDVLDDFESIVLFVDGEPMALEAKGWTSGTIGASEPVYVKPVASATDAFYRVTIDQIRMIAVSRDIEIRAGSARSKQYLRWGTSESDNEIIAAFARQVD